MPNQHKGLFAKKFNTIAKIALPFAALLGNGALASVRSNATSRFAQKSGAIVVKSAPEPGNAKDNLTAAPERSDLANEKQHVFGAFTRAPAQQTKAAEINSDNRALAYLKENGLLAGGATKTSSVSGNTIASGRKQFAASYSCPNPNYTRFYNYSAVPSCFLFFQGGGSSYGTSQSSNVVARCASLAAKCGHLPPADTTPPVVQSITLSGTPSSDATSVDFVVSFDENANNITTSDFLLNKVGSVFGTIASVSASSGSSVTVTVNAISGIGTLRLDLKSNTDITDDAGNGNGTNGNVATFTSGSVHNVTVGLTSTETQFNFSGLDANDSGGSGFATLDNPHIVVQNGFTQDGTEIYGPGNSTDTVTHIIKADGTNSTSFNVETLLIHSFNQARTWGAGTQMVFKDEGGAVIRTMTLNADKSLPATLTSIAAFFDNNNTLPVTGVASIEFTIAPTFGNTAAQINYALMGLKAATDETPPVVQSITLQGSPSSMATSLAYAVAFNENSNNLSVDDFELTTTGATTATISSVSASSGSSVNVNIGSIAGAGSLRLDLKANTDISDDLGNGNGTNGNVAAFSSGEVHTVSTLDNDGALTAAGGVSEPINLNTTIDTVGEAVDVFDFMLSDGGGGDGLAMTVSQIVLDVSGTSTDVLRGNITWRLNGSDASNVLGVYSSVADTLTFSGLSISIADGASEVYTVNTYFNDNTSINDNVTVALSVDGDTSVTVGAGGTLMGSTSAVTNGAGSTIEVVASTLAFTVQPGGSVSGVPMLVHPDVSARDEFGNTDTDFTEVVTLTEASAGTLANNTATAVNGVAEFSNLIYTATADQQSFTLTANDQDGVGSNLPTASSNFAISDVVATQLVFTMQPSPLTINSGEATSLSTVPVVSAVDANSVVDTGYSTGITLSEINGAGSANMTATGDTDGSGATVTMTPSAGVATFTGLAITYTASGLTDENFALQASSGGLTTGNSNQFTAAVDSTGPLVTSVSVPGNATYTSGQNLDFTVNFNENVSVNTGGGTPRIAITIGSTTRYAAYITGSGSSALLFRYTLQSGDNDGDGITVGTLDANAGTLRDAAGNDATLTLNSVGSTTAILVDTAAPSVAEITAVTTPGNDATPDVTISSDEAGTLLVGGSCGSSDEGAIGSGNTTITLTQTDNSAALAAGIYSDCTVTVTDAVGNNSGAVVLSSFEVDLTAPTVSEVTAVATPGNDATPNVTISSGEAGTLTVGGSCGSANEGAISSGNTTITLTQTDDSTALAAGIYSDCTVTVTDAAGNSNTPVTLSSFEIDLTAGSLAITLDNTDLVDGGTSTITFSFEETPVGFSASDISAENAMISNLVVDSSDDKIYTAILTPVLELTDATNIVSVLGSSYEDSAGNSGSSANSPNYTITSSSADALDEVTTAATNNDATGITAGDLNNITGVSNANPDFEPAYQSAIASADAADVDTALEIEAVIATVNAAMQIIIDYADANGSGPSPTVTTYNDAQLDGVSAANLDVVNAYVAALENTAVDSTIETQAVIAAVNALLAEAAGTTGADEADYSTAGITGVTAINLNSINDAVAATIDDGTDIDTPIELQALVDAYAAILDQADGDADPAPTVADFTALGITGVDADNLAAVLDAIAVTANDATDIDTLEELQSVVSADRDLDGVSDSDEIAANTDPDDADSDNDGVCDGSMAFPNECDAGPDTSPNDPDVPMVGGDSDFDNDNIPDVIDSDDDNDGIDDSIEGDSDSDGDDIPDSMEVDSDNDGILDADEAGPDSANPRDTDGDDIPDYADTDADNDGIPDLLETAGDNDLDGIANHLDRDADNDGVPDQIEAPVGISPSDTDMDDIPDYLDRDSDNDGLPDALEDQTRTGLDDDQDGIDNGYDADSFSNQATGISGKIDENGDGLEDGILPSDFDGDGLADMLDPDSDNDGLSDTVEETLLRNDSDGDGIDDRYDVTETGGEDLNNDGVDDAIRLRDSDGDSGPDVRDLDADNDGIPDITETGGTDEDGDGLLDDGADLTMNPTDSDGDGVLDNQTPDADGDGVFDIESTDFAGADTNGDGVIDDLTDGDSDGILDAADNALDQNGNGVLEEVIVVTNNNNNFRRRGGAVGVPVLLLLGGWVGWRRKLQK